jgi:hypothetical protein
MGALSLGTVAIERRDEVPAADRVPAAAFDGVGAGHAKAARSRSAAGRLTAFGVLLALTVGLGASAAQAAARASVRSCPYRNPAAGAVPYVAHVTTDLSARAAGPAGICAVVKAAVRRAQRLGFTLNGAPRVIEAGSAWSVDHHVVYPRGWPSPAGPVFDPHMHVTLRLVAAGTLATRSRRVQDARAGHGFWIRFNEYT